MLLRLGADPPDPAPLLSAASVYGMPLRAIAMAQADIAALYETRLVLVRPDGHVAWRGNECLADAAAIVPRLRGAAGPRSIMPDRAFRGAPRARLL